MTFYGFSYYNLEALEKLKQIFGKFADDATDYAMDFTAFSKPFKVTFSKKLLQLLVLTFKI